jgi:hypothetical protein
MSLAGAVSSAMSLAPSAGCTYAANPRHDHIHQHHVGREPLRQLHGLASITGLTHRLNAFSRSSSSRNPALTTA